MTENKDVNKYLRQTARKLCCSEKTKATLTQGFREELEDYELREYSAICQTYGLPKDAARVMMEDVDEDEIRQQKRKRRLTLAGVLAALVIVIGVLGTFTADAWNKFYQQGTWTHVTHEAIPNEASDLPDGTVQKMLKEGSAN